MCSSSGQPETKCLTRSSEQTENERLAAALAATAKVPSSLAYALAAQAQTDSPAADTRSHEDSPREYLRFMLAYRKAAEALGIPSVYQRPPAVEASEPLPFELVVAAQEFCSPEEDEESGESTPRAQAHTALNL